MHKWGYSIYGWVLRMGMYPVERCLISLSKALVMVLISLAEECRCMKFISKRNEWIPGVLFATVAAVWRNMSKLCSCIQCCSILWFVMGNFWAKMMILHCYTLVEGATCCTRWREHCLSGFLWLVCGFVRHVVLEVPNDSTVSCTTLRKFRLSAETCFITIFRMKDLHWCIACTWKRNI